MTDNPLTQMREAFRYPSVPYKIREIIEYLEMVAYNPGDYLPQAVDDAKHDLELFEKLAAYESEKDLLKKTQDWHEHGMIAPSCVGCPTAEAVIESGKVTVDAAKCDSVQMFVDKLNQARREKDSRVSVDRNRIVTYPDESIRCNMCGHKLTGSEE